MNLVNIKQSMQDLTLWTRQGFAQQNSNFQDLLSGKANYSTGRYVATADELEQTKNAPPNQGEVFNSWHRYSHLLATEDQPAVPSEIDSWTYDPATDTIRNTTNSSSSIGIVSPGKYDQYILDAKLTSSNNDDDTIGLVMAFHVDPLTKRENTLVAIRSPGGSGHSTLYAIWYNHLRSDRILIASNHAMVTWGNGSPGINNAADAGWETNNPGWANTGSYWNNTGGTRLRVERDGDKFVTTTSQWEFSDTLDPNTRFELDLNSHPALAKFKGERPYGFMTQSQANSKWEVLNFTNPQELIYDLKNDQVWEYLDDEWKIKVGASIDDIEPRQYLYNPTTKAMFYFHDRGSITRLGTSVL